jgi:hypothetical protein
MQQLKLYIGAAAIAKCGSHEDTHSSDCARKRQTNSNLNNVTAIEDEKTRKGYQRYVTFTSRTSPTACCVLAENSLGFDRLRPQIPQLAVRGTGNRTRAGRGGTERSDGCVDRQVRQHVAGSISDSIDSEPNRVEVIGSDATGAMYGGIEVAEF